jgi:hypothetical protein
MNYVHLMGFRGILSNQLNFNFGFFLLIVSVIVLFWPLHVSAFVYLSRMVSV